MMRNVVMRKNLLSQGLDSHCSQFLFVSIFVFPLLLIYSPWSMRLKCVASCPVPSRSKFGWADAMQSDGDMWQKALQGTRTVEACCGHSSGPSPIHR